MENNKNVRKVNVGLALTKNFDKVTLELLDEPVEYEDELEFEREIKRRFDSLRGQINIEFSKLKKMYR